MATRNIVPRADGEGGIGTTLKRWANGFFNTMLVESLQIDQANAADGDMWYRSSNIFTRIAKGMANYKMFMNAGATAPEWASGIKIITATRDLTAAGAPTDVAYTGIGFKPGLIFIIATASNTDILEISLGMSDGVTQTNLILLPRATPIVSVASTRIVMSERGASDGSKNQIGVLKSFDADGFTLTWTKTSTPSGTLTMHILALR